eukprot:4550332-Amphidinium_carterae.1
MFVRIRPSRGASKTYFSKTLSGINEDLAAHSLNFDARVPAPSKPADWPTRGGSSKLEELGARRVVTSHPRVAARGRGCALLTCAEVSREKGVSLASRARSHQR